MPARREKNLTLAGLSWETLEPGTQLKIGPKFNWKLAHAWPCEHNARWFRDGDLNRISQRINPGWSRLYAKCCGPAWYDPGMSSRSWRAVRHVWRGSTAIEQSVQ
jgi:hypothetical protein